MGFFDNLGGQKQIGLTEKVAHYCLTPTGEKKLRDMEPTGRIFDICAAIKKLQPCSPKEIADDPGVHWPENKVQYMLNKMTAEGWVQRAG